MERLLNKGYDIGISQIKEKFGTLRLHIYASDSESLNYAQRYTQIFEQMSCFICEECGKPGHLRHVGWKAVQCDECHNKLRHTKFYDTDKSHT